MDSRLLRIESLNVNINGKEILRNISMEIKEGEQWMVVGDAGTGKTVFAHTLAGNRAFRGRIEFSDSDKRSRGSGALVVDQQHRFHDLQNQSNFYYQQRYNSFDAEATMTVSEAISAFDENRHEHFSKKELLETFQLDSILSEPLIQLSNGENKRLQRLILLGRAMIKTPPLLILDEPCQDLDPAQTAFTLQTIDRYCGFFGAGLIFVSHYQEDFRASIRQILRLEKGKIV